MLCAIVCLLAFWLVGTAFLITATEAGTLGVGCSSRVGHALLSTDDMGSQIFLSINRRKTQNRASTYVFVVLLWIMTEDILRPVSQEYLDISGFDIPETSRMLCVFDVGS